jgi:hypothetical protein
VLRGGVGGGGGRGGGREDRLCKVEIGAEYKDFMNAVLNVCW